MEQTNGDNKNTHSKRGSEKMTREAIIIHQAYHKAIVNIARDLASKHDAYWLQMLINNLKLELWAKQGKLLDDRPPVDNK